MSNLPPVVVAMSGGVDSSVAAALLVEQGYPVTGIMLRLWSETGCEDGNRCCTPDSILLARQVAAQFNFPFYVIDVKSLFYSKVVDGFIDGYAQGITPNPCLICNSLIRWGFLLEQAQSMGARYLATGHYARLVSIPKDNIRLYRGSDHLKDQSYVLALLNQHQLENTLLPLGNLTKLQVRKLASDFGLPAANKPDSQDLCFLSGQDYREFLMKYKPSVIVPGKIVDLQGNIIGEHRGLPLYTIGQRKGIRVSARQPLYVIKKDFTQNTLVVGSIEELGQNRLKVDKINWLAPEFSQGTFHAMVQIRYKAKELAACITPGQDGGAEIMFDSQPKDITPGQAAVFYVDERVIGGGIIQI